MQEYEAEIPIPEIPEIKALDPRVLQYTEAKATLEDYKTATKVQKQKVDEIEAEFLPWLLQRENLDVKFHINNEQIGGWKVHVSTLPPYKPFNENTLETQCKRHFPALIEEILANPQAAKDFSNDLAEAFSTKVWGSRPRETATPRPCVMPLGPKAQSGPVKTSKRKRDRIISAFQYAKVNQADDGDADVAEPVADDAIDD